MAMIPELPCMMTKRNCSRSNTWSGDACMAGEQPGVEESMQAPSMLLCGLCYLMKIGQDSSRQLLLSSGVWLWHGEHQINLKQVLPAGMFRLTAFFIAPPIGSEFFYVQENHWHKNAEIKD